MWYFFFFFFFVKIEFDIYFVSFNMCRAICQVLRQIACFALEFVHFIHDHTTPTERELWSKVVAMHANGVSVYYA